MYFFLLLIHKASSRPCDISRALFWLDKALSGGSEHSCRKCNKNIRIHIGVAYFILRLPWDVMQL